MNLLQFRQFFRSESGRYDLVDGSGNDRNNANTFINAGQRYLDILADIPAGKGRYFVDISSGDWLVKFTDCRAVLNVWCIGLNSGGKYDRLPLTKYSNDVLRGVDKKTLEQNYVEITSDLTAARPAYYALAKLRMVNKTGAGIGPFMDVLADGYQTYNGLVLMPPSDSTYSIEIEGHFYSATLSADTDETFWTVQHPTLLYAATMRQLEIVHRNTEGRKDWEAAIQPMMVGLDMDGVAEESSDANVMEG